MNTQKCYVKKCIKGTIEKHKVLRIRGTRMLDTMISVAIKVEIFICRNCPCSHEAS